MQTHKRVIAHSAWITSDKKNEIKGRRKTWAFHVNRGVATLQVNAALHNLALSHVLLSFLRTAIFVRFLDGLVLHVHFSRLLRCFWFGVSAKRCRMSFFPSFQSSILPRRLFFVRDLLIKGVVRQPPGQKSFEELLEELRVLVDLRFPLQKKN